MNQIPKILEDMYLKNLKFFEKQNPQIYSVISNTKPDHSKIIISDEGKIDLIYKGRGIYRGDAIGFATNEVKEFNFHHSGEKRLSGIGCITPDMYRSPRYFHSHIHKTIEDLYIEAGSVYPNTIHHDGRQDFVIITGIGLGLHITELLEKNNIQNLLILENDYELLSLSCFFTDWEYIYKLQSVDLKKSITLTLTNNTNLHNQQTSLWNQLVKKCPQYPFNSITYNHGRNDIYGEILKNVSNDVKMFFSLWGFYDDEKNQLNHVMHNLKREIKLIPKKEDFKFNKPVIICGSGPSLDNRIEQLKSIRESCILISAGTSLHALLEWGVIPDFHVELESDFNVYSSFKSILNRPELKNINLICAIQCTPYITSLFKECYSFIKDSMALGDILEPNINDRIYEATPTCVNSAISIALHYQAEDIYLFGTDFGFYNQNNHHSKHSIYNNQNLIEEDERLIVETSKGDMKRNFEKPGYKGDCLTTATYYTTKRRVDILITRYKNLYNFNIYNLSDGLIIEDTIHLKKHEKINLVSDLNIDNMFEVKCRNLSSNIENLFITNLHEKIESLCNLLIINLKDLENNAYSLSALCWSISSYLSNGFEKECGSIVFFIRGTIWHYLATGYTITYACEPENQAAIIDLWKKRFINLLETLPPDLLSEIKKKRTTLESDYLLTKTISEG